MINIEEDDKHENGTLSQLRDAVHSATQHPPLPSSEGQPVDRTAAERGEIGQAPRNQSDNPRWAKMRALDVWPAPFATEFDRRLGTALLREQKPNLCYSPLDGSCKLRLDYDAGLKAGPSWGSSIGFAEAVKSRDSKVEHSAIQGRRGWQGESNERYG